MGSFFLVIVQEQAHRQHDDDECEQLFSVFANSYAHYSIE
jgi:hypothetical protein